MTDISLSCNVHAFNSHARRKCSSGFLNISHLIHCHELSHYNETVLNIFLISGAVNPNNWSPTNIDIRSHTVPHLFVSKKHQLWCFSETLVQQQNILSTESKVCLECEKYFKQMTSLKSTGINRITCTHWSLGFMGCEI